VEAYFLPGGAAAGMPVSFQLPMLRWILHGQLVLGGAGKQGQTDSVAHLAARKRLPLRRG
jgi:hypothetical protein